MTPLTLATIAFLLALVLFGFAFWTPLYAIPLALIFVVGLGLSMFRRGRGSSRRQREFRRQRGTPEHDVQFTDRDRQTLYERD